MWSDIVSRLNVVSAPVLAGLMLLSGCEAIPKEADDWCDDTRDCPLGSVCMLPEHECAEEPANAAVGSFSCLLINSGEKTTNVGYTDVVVRVGKFREALTTSSICTVREQGQSVGIFIHRIRGSTGPSTSLLVSVDRDFVSQGGTRTYDITAGKQNRGAILARYVGNDSEVIAAATNAEITLEPAKLHETLRGYIRSNLVPLTQ